MLFDLRNNSEKQEIIAMIEEYRNSIQPIITAQLQAKFKPSKHRKVVEQTTSAWFSKEQVLALLEQSSDINGIRLYFAAHNKSTVADVDSGTEYQGQLTVVMVATEPDAEKLGGFSSSDVLHGIGLDRGSLCKNDCPPGSTVMLVR